MLAEHVHRHLPQETNQLHSGKDEKNVNVCLKLHSRKLEQPTVFEELFSIFLLNLLIKSSPNLKTFEKKGQD